MTGKEFKDVWDRIDQEGFDYTFVHYSKFDEIKDKRFHKLREAYLLARKNFIDYLGWEEAKD
jgi:hypothetical protein